MLAETNASSARMHHVRSIVASPWLAPIAGQVRRDKVSLSEGYQINIFHPPAGE